MPPQEEVWSYARRLAQPFLWSLSETELSGVEILSQLREAGLGYRMTDFYADLRRYRELGIREPYVEALGPTEFVPRTWMMEVPPELWHIGGMYKAVGVVQYWSEEEEEWIEREVTVGYLREMSKEEIRDYVLEVVPWEMSPPEAYDFIQTGTMHLAGAGY